MYNFRKLLVPIVLFCNLTADELKVGANYLAMNYVETGRNGQFLDSETSDYTNIDGFHISYKRDIGKLSKDNQMTSLELSYRQFTGITNYDGSLYYVATGQFAGLYKTTTQNDIKEIKARIIQTKYTADYDLSVFASFGNREWTRNISGDTANNVSGINEIYSWNYYDLGMKATFYDGHWETGLEFGYQAAIDPTMVAYMSKTLKFDLTDVKGFYYKIPIGYNLDKNLKFELAYEYNNWDIGASNVVSGYYEPDSTTKNKIISLNLVYKF